MGEGRGNCGGGDVCKEVALLEKQIEALESVPLTVSKLTGIVSVIAGLFALLVGLAFNSHFEQLRQAETMNKKFDTLAIQIIDMDEAQTKSKRVLSDRLIRIEALLPDKVGDIK